MSVQCQNILVCVVDNHALILLLTCERHVRHGNGRQNQSKTKIDVPFDVKAAQFTHLYTLCEATVPEDV